MAAIAAPDGFQFAITPREAVPEFDTDGNISGYLNQIKEVVQYEIDLPNNAIYFSLAGTSPVPGGFIAFDNVRYITPYSL